MQEPLFFFFGILALYLLSKTRSNKDLILVGFLLFFSLLSKETGALFFIVSIMFAFFSNKKYFLPLLGIEVLLLFLYFLLRINAVGIYANPFNAPIAKIDLPNRLLNIPAMIFFYLKTFVFPLKLSASYHWIVKQANFDLFFLPLTAILLFTALFVYFAYIIFKKHKESYFVPYLFFGTWFILGLFFHLQIIPLDATVAERWFYFPLVGLLGMAGLFSEIFLSRTKGEWVLMVSLFLIFLLSIRTFIRSFDWRDNLRLATQDIKVSPESYALENLMAQGLIVQNRLEEAKVHVERSVKFYPYSTNYINLGYIYFSMGDYPKAKEAYLKALEFGDYYLTYEGLAAVSVLYGDPRESIEFVKSALKKFPQSARLWLDLALLNYKVGNISEAKILARKAYSLSQDAATVSFYREIVNETLDFNSK
ncbi:MAG: tetratricopeptide repeat protein [Patescibacteria group bacterium]